MKAAFFCDTQTIRVEEKPIPEVSAHEILIKVRASAICGTDLRIYKFGHFKIPAGTKRVLGHEVAGEIVKIGSQVKHYQVGDRVALPPNVGCGVCDMCSQGYNQLCPDYEAFGISYDGGFQDYLVVPANAIAQGNVIKLPNDIDFIEAAMIEPLSCAYNSYQALHIVPGDTVLIVGAGPIGACHVMMSRLAGATSIIVADVADNRLAAIKQFGADHVINSAQQDLRQAVLDANCGQPPSVIITACSVAAVQTQALEIAGIHTRINFFGGMPKGKELVNLNTNLIHYKELTVLGTTGSSIRDYIQTMKLVASGRIQLAPLATKTFVIDEIQDAFDYALSGEGMKTVIVS